MNILFIGDVVGRPGRRVLAQTLTKIQREYAIDFTIVNVENAAGGFGITAEILDEFNAMDIDVMTTGNHVWDKREALDFIDQEPRLLRPANYPDGTPGEGVVCRSAHNGTRVAVINVMGIVFMHPTLACPFACVNDILKTLEDDVRVVFVDFHAEATSEKVAMGWHLNGRVSAVLGTHTHVPTADERVLPKGTAYISDVGMTGCYDSVIGMETGKVLKRFVQKLPERFETAQGKASLCGAIVEIDETSGQGLHIQRVRWEE